MNEAVLNLGIVISSKSTAFKNILTQIPPNVEIQYVNFSAFNNSKPTETRIYFESDDFKVTPIGKCPPDVKWDGKKLDFTNCWDTLKVLQPTIPASFQLPHNAIAQFDLAYNNIFEEKILGCFHVWKKYTGIIDSYTYCDKCGEKQK